MYWFVGYRVLIRTGACSILLATGDGQPRRDSSSCYAMPVPPQVPGRAGRPVGVDLDEAQARPPGLIDQVVTCESGRSRVFSNCCGVSTVEPLAGRCAWRPLIDDRFSGKSTTANGLAEKSR